MVKWYFMHKRQDGYFTPFLFLICNPFIIFPTNIYLFKFNNRNTRTRYAICSKLTIKTPEGRH